MIAAQRGLVEKLGPGLRAKGHRHRHGAVELDDRGAGERRHTVVGAASRPEAFVAPFDVEAGRWGGSRMRLIPVWSHSELTP